MSILPDWPTARVRAELRTVGVDAVRSGAPLHDVALLAPDWCLYDVEVEWTVDLEDAEATARAAGLEVLRTAEDYPEHECPGCDCVGGAVVVVRSVGRHAGEAREQIVAALLEYSATRRHPHLVALAGGGQ